MLHSRSRSSSTPNSSPPNSPQKKHRLSMAGVANIFVKMRGLEEKAVSTDELELSSGDPKTHPNVAEGAKNYEKIPVEQTDNFICAGGVNVTTLLRITRIALMEHVERELGANSVVDEQCVCSMLFLFLLLIFIPSFCYNLTDGNVLFPDRNPYKAESTKFRYSPLLPVQIH